MTAVLPRALAWPVCLAALFTAVLGTRTYVDLDRVRVRLVTTPRRAETGSLSVPLRDRGRLEGMPVAIVLRVRGAADPVRLSVLVDERTIEEIAVSAEEEIRVDTAVDRLSSQAGEISVRGSAPGWTLTYLEVATVHGYAERPLELLIAPRARRAPSVLPVWALVLVFVALVAARPRPGWPPGRARHAYRLIAGVLLLVLLAALAAPAFTPYTILLSLQSVLLVAVVLYAEPLCRVAGPYIRPVLRVRPVPEPVDLPGWREVVAAAAGLTLTLGVMLNVQVRNLDSVPDLGDPLFSIWRISWVLHQLVADPWHLFDANIFYPARGTLTYSDSIILPALTTWPLLAAGIHRVAAYNLVFLSALVLSGVATYVLARSFGWRPAAAWTAGLIFMVYPFRIDHYSHLELQMSQWMPLAVLGAHRLMLGGGWRYAALSAGALGAQWYSCMYYALFLSLYVAVFAAVLAVSWRRPARLAGVAAALLAGSALAAPIALAYSAAQRDRTRPIDTVEALSATPADYLQPTSRSAWYAGMNPSPAQAERQLFPGLVPMTLAVAGAWPPMSATRLAVLASGVVAFDASLGMNGLTYPWLYEYLFPFRSVRVPARFAMLVGLTLALLSGVAIERWLRRLSASRGRWIPIAAMLAIVFDAWPSLALVPVWPEPPPIYGALGPSTGAVLMEYPLNPEPGNHPENIPYLYFSSWHHTPMVNGYSGFTSPGYASLAKAMEGFPQGDTLPFLERTGVTHISVICALDGVFGRQGVPQRTPRRCEETIRQLDADPRVRAVVRATWNGAPALLYELR